MADVETLSVALTGDMLAELRAAVEEGDYASVGEAIDDALRHWRVRRRSEPAVNDELRRLVVEGMESGPGLDPDEVFGRLRAKFGAPPSQ